MCVLSRELWSGCSRAICASDTAGSAIVCVFVPASLVEKKKNGDYDCIAAKSVAILILRKKCRYIDIFDNTTTKKKYEI